MDKDSEVIIHAPFPAFNKKRKNTQQNFLISSAFSRAFSAERRPNRLSAPYGGGRAAAGSTLPEKTGAFQAKPVFSRFSEAKGA
ncbi:hypothetical protein [Dysosmobacter sp. HCP28S3_G4]|uniref:hypothetical protein n=1 Tax=Dysosmobacter sp. HCP28S3_G4 TaxID=3438938 RepID=UPI003F8AE4DA